METINPVSENIRKVRLEKKISSTELANKIGVSQVTLTEIERGARPFDYQRLLDIANALNVNVDKLVPPYIDLGRCVKMPQYTPEELNKLETEWQHELEKCKYEEKASVKNHNICSISIDTSRLELSDILKVNDYVNKLSYLNKVGYSALEGNAEKLIETISNTEGYQPLMNKELQKVLSDLKNSKSEYDYLIGAIAEVLGKMFF